jgi:hypothetical protein
VLTGVENYLTKSAPAGPRARTEAEKVWTRLLGEVDERRNPTTRATVDQPLEHYLDVLDVEPTTRARYEGSSGCTSGLLSVIFAPEQGGRLRAGPLLRAAAPLP